jgi:hypothetical protein
MAYELLCDAAVKVYPALAASKLFAVPDFAAPDSYDPLVLKFDCHKPVADSAIFEI